MLQYKIPQNVGLEDKIVGPFSLRQLIIVAVGGGISYVLFAILAKMYELNIIEYIVIALPALISAAAALIRINDVSLTKFVLLTLEYNMKPKKRLWDHRGILSITAPDLSEKADNAPVKKEEAAKKPVNLRDLTLVLDSGGFDHVEKVEHPEIDKAADDDLIQKSFLNQSKDDAGSFYLRTKDAHMKILEEIAKKKPDKAVAAKAAVASSTPAAPVVKAAPPAPPAQPPRAVVAPRAAQPPVVKPPQNSSAPQNPPTPAAVKAPSVAPRTAPTPTVSNPPASPANAPAGTPKKRKRNRKKSNAAPARPSAQINNTQKSKPVEYLPAPQTNLPPAAPAKTDGQAPKATQTPSNNPSEIRFEELQKGEIEINLD